MNLLEYCKDKRRELGNWGDVAAFLGMDKSSFSLLLNGQRKPSLDLQIRIREKSGAQVSDVLDFVVNKRPARGR